ncbi:D-2-hydroxyacid dehydrogenase family protein [Deinococcus roseus]|uniref:2-hydroxyacid dehydrogenase n=1 Tax=Deinococcus roseus TaxID=392414 RepID=A0ABQ2CY80_9DEIO|nr:D-2-hydroxyacid dehydrogenase family protein [Deinococcus roseus]GGJ32575.1 2-hydroxyacid dehydrogenase [Deinococcus roseus]
MTFKRCAVLDDDQQVALQLADWSVLAPQVHTTAFHEHFDSEARLIETLQDFEMVVIMRERTPFPAQVLQHLPHLKLLVTSGMRNASIDLTAARNQGITVCGTSSSSQPPIELTWALILGLARHLHTESHHFKTSGPWQSTLGTGLSGKHLGVLGLGKIGSQVARIGQAFGMQVSAWSQNLTPEKAREHGVTLAANKMALLEQADVITLHLVLSERTRGMIGQGELRSMKPNAHLINTSRAAIVNEHALIQALKENWIAGAGLDVYEQEPLPANHPLRTLPNVLGTPHLGYVTEENYRVYFQQAVEDIQAYLQGQPIRVL